MRKILPTMLDSSSGLWYDSLRTKVIRAHLYKLSFVVRLLRNKGKKPSSYQTNC